VDEEQERALIEDGTIQAMDFRDVGVPVMPHDEHDMTAVRRDFQRATRRSSSLTSKVRRLCSTSGASSTRRSSLSTGASCARISVATEGIEVDMQGDAFFVAFPAAHGAVQAASEAQEAFAAGPVRVRIGVHAGRPKTRPLDHDHRFVADDPAVVPRDVYDIARAELIRRSVLETDSSPTWLSPALL
jgi:hypothetical protein